MKSIETSRLYLRPFTLDDAQDMFEYAKSPHVGPHAGWSAHTHIEESKGIIRMFIEQDEVLAIVQKSDRKVIGSIGLHQDTKRLLGKDEVRSLGYVLGEDYWGHGYATEAARAVLRHAFRDLGIKLISVYHYEGNARSRHVIEKLGFRYEGTQRMASASLFGGYRNDLCYSMFAEEFEEHE